MLFRSHYAADFGIRHRILKAYKNRDWVDVTATVRKEYIEAYQGEGPVLYVDKITTCAKPAQEVVSF